MRGELGHPARVLFVDDGKGAREQAAAALVGRVRLECVGSAAEARRELAREPADLVVCLLRLPDGSGLDVLEHLLQVSPQTAFVLLVDEPEAQSEIRALRAGAAETLRKPHSSEELALCIERVLARRELQLENERLRGALAITEACRTLLQCADPGEVYAAALDLLLRTLGRTRGVAIFRRTAIPGSEGMVFRGLGETQARALRRSLAESKPTLFESAEAVAEERPGVPFEDALREAGIPGGAVLAVPLRGGDAEVGMAWVFADGRPFGEREREQARLVAGHAGLALQNAERYHRAKERAFVDDVTEVYNARYLLQATEREIQRAERSGKELSVLFLDLDRFKRVNDEHGHLVGSQVLRHLSKVLAECVRQVDTLARYGGDEFTILLVDTPHDAAMGVAERIRCTVADTLFEGGGGAPVRLTISIGVATSPRHARERDALLDCADKAMYRAKSLGRNCVCSATDLRV
ncbi:MAG TPA: diguanylate cyclase [Myxococcota bacterium]|nr:diguanylate cyclase [Myxococcota bacterium]